MSTARSSDEQTARRIDTPNKARDRAFILPVVGVLLLIPPLAGIFQLDIKIAGIPFTVIYLFTIWAALIAGAAMLSRRLLDDDELSIDPGLGEPAAQHKTERRNMGRRDSDRQTGDSSRRAEPD